MLLPFWLNDRTSASNTERTLSKRLRWTVLASLLSSGMMSVAFFILSSKPFGEDSPLGKCGNPYSVPPEKEWRNSLRGEAAWPGMAAGFAQCWLAVKLIVDNLIGHKQAIRTYGRSLRLFCVATSMMLVFAIALTAKDILDMTGHVDSSYYTEDVVCSPNQAWYMALGLAMFGLFSCVLTYYLIEFQYLRNEDTN